MAHGRQSSEWAQSLYIGETANNLFREKSNRFDVAKLIPLHLRPNKRRRADRVISEAESTAAWAAIAGAMMGKRG